MIEPEEQEILDLPQNDQVNATAGAPAEALPCAPAPGECSIEVCAEAPARDSGDGQQADRKDASMDIHAPMGKIKSLKEFATHILIVTIGILIAFSLEGARESWREHAAVKELRESLRAELTSDQEQLGNDLRQVRQCNVQLDKMIAEMPGLAKSPQELNRRVGELRPGFYGLNTTAWESALSSNTLTFMDRNERNLFVGAYFGIKYYREISITSAMASYNDVATYFPSHRSYATDAEEAEAERKLRALRNEFGILNHLGQQIVPDLQKALDSK